MNQPKFDQLVVAVPEAFELSAENLLGANAKTQRTIDGTSLWVADDSEKTRAAYPQLARNLFVGFVEAPHTSPQSTGVYAGGHDTFNPSHLLFRRKGVESLRKSNANVMSLAYPTETFDHDGMAIAAELFMRHLEDTHSDGSRVQNSFFLGHSFGGRVTSSSHLARNGLQGQPRTIIAAHTPFTPEQLVGINGLIAGDGIGHLLLRRFYTQAVQRGFFRDYLFDYPPRGHAARLQSLSQPLALPEQFIVTYHPEDHVVRYTDKMISALDPWIFQDQALGIPDGTDRHNAMEHAGTLVAQAIQKNAELRAGQG